MSEEQEQKTEEKPEEKAAPDKSNEKQEEVEAKDASLSTKNKKINKMSPEELEKKIAAFEETNQSKSRYYRHLLQRREELQAMKQEQVQEKVQEQV